MVGAAGGIGQPMSLLLKLSGKIEHLSLFDIVNTPGVAADISHCDAKAKASKHGRRECCCRTQTRDSYSSRQPQCCCATQAWLGTQGRASRDSVGP